VKFSFRRLFIYPGGYDIKLGEQVRFLAGYNKWTDDKAGNTAVANGVSGPILWKIWEAGYYFVP